MTRSRGASCGSSSRRILYIQASTEANEARRRVHSRLVMRGLQGLWVATAIVALPRRRMQPGAKALLLVPLLYLTVHLALRGGYLLSATHRGGPPCPGNQRSLRRGARVGGRRDPRGLASRATGDRRRARRFRCPGGVELAAAVLQYLLGEDSAQLTPVLTDVRVRGQRHVLGGRLRREGRRARKLHPIVTGGQTAERLGLAGVDLLGATDRSRRELAHSRVEAAQAGARRAPCAYAARNPRTCS